MFHINISDEHDIAEAVRKLIVESIDKHESEQNDELLDKVDRLDSDICVLQEIADDRQNRIEYLESLLKENFIDFDE